MKITKIIPIAALLLAATTARAQSDGDTTESSLLKGTLLSQRLSSGSVAVLKSSANGLGFYLATSATTIAANTAYVPMPRTILINLASLDAAPTAISDIQRPGTDQTAEQGGKGKTQYSYDLSGRRRHDRQHGITVVRQTDGHTVKVLTK